MSADTTPASIAISVDIPRRIGRRAGYDPDALIEALGRICDLALPMIAEGVPPEVIIRKISPREWSGSADWPPRGTEL